jgi:WD40 repeat protein
LKLWDVATGNEGADLKGQARVDSLAYRPDGRMLASASEDGVIKLWDPAIAKELATLKAHSKSIHSLAFSADSTMLVSGSEDNTIKIWELPKAK